MGTATTGRSGAGGSGAGGASGGAAAAPLPRPGAAGAGPGLAGVVGTVLLNSPIGENPQNPGVDPDPLGLRRPLHRDWPPVELLRQRDQALADLRARRAEHHRLAEVDRADR